MSGLAGICHFDERPLDPATLMQVAGPVAHRGGDQVDAWSGPSAGLVCHLRQVLPESAGERQPAIDESGRALVFDGRLDNRDELLASLRADGVRPGMPDAALVLAAYGRWGRDSLAKLDGEFALAVVEPTARTVCLARDAVGCRPLYFWAGQRTLVFASEIKAILAHPDVRAAPNHDLIADLVLLDRLPYDDHGATFFEGIQAVRPGCCVSASPGGVRTHVFWDFDPTASRRYATYDEYAQHLRDLLLTAMKRRLRSLSAVGVSVSGGLDSAAVLCMADHLRRAGAVAVDFFSLTYTSRIDPTSEENRFLAILESGGSRLIERVVPGRCGEAERDAIDAWHSEAPIIDEGWCAQRPLVERARERGARLLMTGLWSDQLMFSTGYLVDLVRRLRWRLAARHLREYTRWFVDAEPAYFHSVFRRDLRSWTTPGPLQPMLRRLHFARAGRNCPAAADREWAARIRRVREPARRPRFDNAHAKAIYQTVRSQARRLQLEIDEKLHAGCGVETVTPFLDREVIAFVMSVPGEILTRDGVPRRLLRDALRGIVPEAILQRRWRDEPSAASTAAVADDRAAPSAKLVHCLEHRWLRPGISAADVPVAFRGLDLWARRFFSDADLSGKLGATCGTAV